MQIWWTERLLLSFSVSLTYSILRTQANLLFYFIAMGRHQTRDHDCLRLALDDGSGQLKIAGQHVLKGEDAQTVGIDIVYLQQGFSELEQKFVIDDSDNKFDHLLQGDHQVTQWTNNNPGRDHKVIANQKFAFFKKYQTHPLTKCFWKALEGFAGKPGDRGNLHEFTQWRYEEIRKASIDFYKRHKVEGLRWPSQYWDDIAIELIITVPAVWDNHTCSILRNAAADAGFKNVNLRLEPICAAALHMRTLKEKGTIQVSELFRLASYSHTLTEQQDGDVLAFIDTGKGSAREKPSIFVHWLTCPLTGHLTNVSDDDSSEI